MTSWLNFTTFDIIGDLFFSDSFQALEKGTYHRWMSSVFGATKTFVIIKSAAAYPILDFIFQALLKYVPAAQRARVDHESYTRDKIARRLESKKNHKDFMR